MYSQFFGTLLINTRVFEILATRLGDIETVLFLSYATIGSQTSWVSSILKRALTWISWTKSSPLPLSGRDEELHIQSAEAQRLSASSYEIFRNTSSLPPTVASYISRPSVLKKYCAIR